MPRCRRGMSAIVLSLVNWWSATRASCPGESWFAAMERVRDRVADRGRERIVLRLLNCRGLGVVRRRPHGDGQVLRARALGVEKRSARIGRDSHKLPGRRDVAVVL